MSVVSAVLVAAHGSIAHRTGIAVLVGALFAFASLVGTLVIPAGPLPESTAKPEHHFTHRCGGVP